MEKIPKSLFNKKTVAALASIAIFGGLFTETSNADQTYRQNSVVSHNADTKYLKRFNIEGNQVCINQTNAALKLLYNKDHKDFKVVSKYIDIIQCVPDGTGMYAFEDKPRMTIGDQERQAGINWYAGTIVHESKHSALYNGYKQRHPNKTVPDNVWSGSKAEIICLDAQAEALKKIDAPHYMINYVEELKKNPNIYDQPTLDRKW